MVDVKSKVCRQNGCDKRSSFGEPGKPPRYCAKHRPIGMIDVVHRRCETPICDRHPTYGYKGQRRRFCANHTVRVPTLQSRLTDTKRSKTTFEDQIRTTEEFLREAWLELIRQPEFEEYLLYRSGSDLQGADAKGSPHAMTRALFRGTLRASSAIQSACPRHAASIVAVEYLTC